MKTICVDDLIYERLASHARPFETEGQVINRALDALDHQADTSSATSGARMDSERRIDPLRLPDMMFTKVLDATIHGKVVTRPNWNRLLLRMVRLANEHANNFDDLIRLFPMTNIVSGRKVNQGYRYLSDINVSVQGQPANSACPTIVKTARKLDIALDIGFRWRDKEEAAYPGDRARIQTTGSTISREDRMQLPPVPVKKPLHLILRGKRDGIAVTAHGREYEGGFLVRSGSMAAKNQTRSISRGYSKLREDLIRQGVFKSEGLVYRLDRDYLFRSPSAASSVLLGRESNGLTEWKDTTGRALKEIQEDTLR